MVQKQEIIIKHREGVSNRQIAIALGIDKNTVNTYVKEYDRELRKLLGEHPDKDENELSPCIMEKPHYNTENRDICDRSKAAFPIIKDCLRENEKKLEDGRSKQRMRIKDIRAYLKDEKGIKLSYSTVKRLVRGIEQKKKEAFIRQEHIPGAETEFDWGTVKLNIADTGYKKYQIAVFASAYGSYRYSRLYRTQDTAAFQESHVDYFDFCGGVYNTVVYDNMKVAVRKFVGPTEKEPTEALLELSVYYGFKFRFCNVCRGNEKSAVERSVDVVRHAAFSAPGKDCFDSLEDANKHLLETCMKLNSEQLSDGRIPGQAFEEERPYLICAKPRMSCFINRTKLKVDKYSTVVVNGVHYSVPDTLVGKKLDARVYTGRVEIYDNGDQVARHERHYRKGEYVLDIFHFLRTLKRKPGALPQSSALMQSDTSIKSIYETHYTTSPKDFLDVMQLINEIGVEAVEKAINELLKKTSHDLSADKIRLIHDRMKEKENEPGKMKEDKLSRKSKQTLAQYVILMYLQKGRAG